MGVKKATEAVYSLIESGKKEKISTFGPLIHNRLVLDYLAKKGVGVIDDPKDANGVVVIRAHGIHPDIRTKLEERNIELIDATCPRVLNSQKKVREASEKGLSVIIVGDKDHGEVQGIAGYAKNVSIIENMAEAEKISITLPALLISQTTYGKEEYDSISAILKKRFPGIEVADSICPATGERQKALIDMAGKVDAIIVIGGKNSANTVRLYETALKLEKKVWHIESENEIPDEVKDFSVIGITAGASTPDWVIKKVADNLKRY
ncbi:MAG: 4-hydroxy-3-methylbut-2-enyl diphosphate reductase [Spirochaetaceae bacterium]|nr:4-hydroxy-3-methylbut-2-enyl diphosphate reductase [Spirochaetaceae bacterium]